MIPASWPDATTFGPATHVLDQDGSRAAGSFGNDAWIWNETSGASLIPRPPSLSAYNMIPAGLTDDGKMLLGRAECPIRDAGDRGGCCVLSVCTRPRRAAWSHWSTEP